MRTVSSAAAAVLSQTVIPSLVMSATSWLGTVSLGPVPIVTGSWSVVDDESQAVHGELTFDVPRLAKWIATTPTHPLAAYGQQIRAWVGIRLAGGGTEWVAVGRWRILTAKPVDDTIQVTCASLEKLVEWDRLLAPVRITGPTRSEGLVTLLDTSLPVLVRATANPAMGPLPVDRDRLQGMQDLLDAWPARAYVDDQGTLIVTDPWSDLPAPVPVWSTAGRLLSTDPGDSDDSGFNGYSVSTVPEDGTTAPVVETWVLQSGPMAWGPPYGRRPGFFESPTLPADRVALANVAQNLTLGAARRARNLRVTTLPDPRVQRGDVILAVDHARGVDMVGRVLRTALTRTALELTVAEVRS